MKEVMKFLKMLKWHPKGEFIMNTFKLKEIAEVNSGVTVRRYIDKGSNNFKEVIVQKSIQKGRKLSDLQKMEMSSKLNERYFTVKGDILMKTPFPMM